MILFVKVVSFSESNIVNFLVVILFVIRKTLPFFSKKFGELIPFLFTFRSFFTGSFEEETHVGIHGWLGGLKVGDTKRLFEVPFVLFKAVLVLLHEKLITDQPAK